MKYSHFDDTRATPQQMQSADHDFFEDADFVEDATEADVRSANVSDIRFNNLAKIVALLWQIEEKHPGQGIRGVQKTLDILTSVRSHWAKYTIICLLTGRPAPSAKGIADELDCKRQNTWGQIVAGTAKLGLKSVDGLVDLKNIPKADRTPELLAKVVSGKLLVSDLPEKHRDGTIIRGVVEEMRKVYTGKTNTRENKADLVSKAVKDKAKYVALIYTKNDKGKGRINTTCFIDAWEISTFEDKELVSFLDIEANFGLKDPEYKRVFGSSLKIREVGSNKLVYGTEDDVEPVKFSV